MGNTLDTLIEHKSQLSLAALAISLAGFSLYQKKQNEQLGKVANSIDPYVALFVHQHPQTSKEINQQTVITQLLRFKEYPIYKIGITGGPCAGKSTALNTIADHFRKDGFNVMIVPEVPTIVANGGGLKDFYKLNSKQRMFFQLDLIKLKMYIENYIVKMAQMAKKPTLVLCDRGIVDCAAYMTGEQFQALLDESGWTWSMIRDKRYDSVIFMNTAAKGAQEFYTLQNNAARTQTAEFARQLDDKTLDAWIGHPYMSICPNIKGKPFSYKVDLAIKAVQKTIGIESTQMVYHKLLVHLGQFPKNLRVVNSTIEQIYLKNTNPRYVQDKVKKRGQDNSYTYQRKYVGPYRPDIPFRQVTRVSLNSLQYATLVQNQIDPSYRPIYIKRSSFSWQGYYYSLDRIDVITEIQGAYFLRFQADKQSDISQLIPPWVTLIRDVRTETRYQLSKLAQKAQ